MDNGIPVQRLSSLRQSGRYDVVKTCYHQSIMLVEDYKEILLNRLEDNKR